MQTGTRFVEPVRGPVSDQNKERPTFKAQQGCILQLATPLRRSQKWQLEKHFSEAEPMRELVSTGVCACVAVCVAVL